VKTVAPKVGDVVFVAQHNEYDNNNTVAPAIVTHVYTQDDGDPRWWDAAKDKEIVDATVFARGNAAATTGTFGKAEQVTVDDGEGGTITYPVGYATTADGFGDVEVSPAPGTATPLAATSPATQTSPQGLSDADIQRLAAALRSGDGTPTQEPTQTVGDGADVATPGPEPTPGEGGGFPAP
jgi:hypothetical protein